MLRVTVRRESAIDSAPIAEVVIGKFAGSEQRGGYAARILEPPSQYSNGIDAFFAVRGHERYQPAIALVASVLSAWHDGRTDEVGEGVRAALSTLSGRVEHGALTEGPPPAPAQPAAGAQTGIKVTTPPPTVTTSAPASIPDPVARAARILTERPDHPALQALAAAILAVAET